MQEDIDTCAVLMDGDCFYTTGGGNYRVSANSSYFRESPISFRFRALGDDTWYNEGESRTGFPRGWIIEVYKYNHSGDIDYLQDTIYVMDYGGDGEEGYWYTCFCEHSDYGKQYAYNW